MNIVTQKVDKTRAKTITWFITLLSELFTIRNYIGFGFGDFGFELTRARCLAMLAALNSAPVSRLRATFLLVPKKSVKIFSAISDELSPDKNYKKLRDLQQSHIDQGIPGSLQIVGFLKYLRPILCPIFWTSPPGSQFYL